VKFAEKYFVVITENALSRINQAKLV